MSCGGNVFRYSAEWRISLRIDIQHTVLGLCLQTGNVAVPRCVECIRQAKDCSQLHGFRLLLNRWDGKGFVAGVGQRSTMVAGHMCSELEVLFAPPERRSKPAYEAGRYFVVPLLLPGPAYIVHQRRRNENGAPVNSAAFRLEFVCDQSLSDQSVIELKGQIRDML